MDYVEVNCVLAENAPDRDIVIALLADAGFDTFEETENGVAAYIPAHLFDRQTTMETLMLPGLNWHEKNIPHANWNEVWENSYQPVMHEGLFCIRASFHAPVQGVLHDIVIDPKMSFGTGHHDTTIMMMRLMLECDIKGKAAYDVGTGTGILAIFAKMLGARIVKGVDIDPYCMVNAMENALKNNCGDIGFKSGTVDDVTESNWDIVMANINRNSLMHDMESYGLKVKADGWLIISGFMECDENDLLEQAALHGFYLARKLHSGNWSAMKLVKKND